MADLTRNTTSCSDSNQSSIQRASYFRAQLHDARCTAKLSPWCRRDSRAAQGAPVGAQEYHDTVVQWRLPYGVQHRDLNAELVAITVDLFLIWSQFAPGSSAATPWSDQTKPVVEKASPGVVKSS